MATKMMATGTLWLKFGQAVKNVGRSARGVAYKMGLVISSTGDHKHHKYSTGTVSSEDFGTGLSEGKLCVQPRFSDREIQMLLAYHSDRAGNMYLFKLLDGVRQPLSTVRQNAVRKLFKELGGGQDCSGTVDPKAFEEALHPGFHPLVMQKMRTGDEIVRDQVSSFDEGPIDFPEFMDYFKTQSLFTTSDDQFERFVAGCWSTPDSRVGPGVMRGGEFYRRDAPLRGIPRVPVEEPLPQQASSSLEAQLIDSQDRIASLEKQLKEVQSLVKRK